MTLAQQSSVHSFNHISFIPTLSLVHGADVGSIDLRKPLGVNEARISVFNFVLSKLRDDALSYPEWFDELDLIDVDVCTRSELDALIVSAPTQFIQGLLYGKLTLRIQLSSITGRGFDDFGKSRAVNGAAVSNVMHAIDARLRDLSEKFQEWFDEFDLIDPDFCTREELTKLMLGAPTSFVEGMLFGKFTMRIQMAALTGRTFV